MSKVYEALKQAERERSTEERDTLALFWTRVTEELDVLRAEIAACQEQLAPLAARIDVALEAGPAAVDALGRRVAQLAAQQERLATESRQFLEGALQRFNEQQAVVRTAQHETVQQTRQKSEEAHAVATSIGQRVEQLAALESKLEPLTTQQQLTHQRIDRLTESLGTTLHALSVRVDALGQESGQARDSVQAEIANVRQQLGEALHDRDHRLEQLAHEVQAAQSNQQLVVAEIRQQTGSMDTRRRGDGLRRILSSLAGPPPEPAPVELQAKLAEMERCIDALRGVPSAEDLVGVERAQRESVNATLTQQLEAMSQRLEDRVGEAYRLIDQVLFDVRRERMEHARAVAERYSPPAAPDRHRPGYTTQWARATPPRRWQPAVVAVLVGLAVMGSALVLFFWSGGTPLSTLIQGLESAATRLGKFLRT